MKDSPKMQAHKPLDARLAYRLIYPLRHSWVRANHLTTLRLMSGIGACVFFSLGDYLWANIGAVCFVMSHFLDHTDGELARMSKTGDHSDLASDAAVNILLFIGIGIGMMQSDLGTLALARGLLAGVAVAAIFHMRLAITGEEGAGQPGIGVIEAEDVLYLLPLITLLSQLQGFLILAGIGAPLFSLWVLHAYLGLKKSPLK